MKKKFKTKLDDKIKNSTITLKKIINDERKIFQIIEILILMTGK